MARQSNNHPSVKKKAENTEQSGVQVLYTINPYLPFETYFLIHLFSLGHLPILIAVLHIH